MLGFKTPFVTALLRADVASRNEALASSTFSRRRPLDSLYETFTVLKVAGSAHGAFPLVDSTNR